MRIAKLLDPIALAALSRIAAARGGLSGAAALRQLVLEADPRPPTPPPPLPPSPLDGALGTILGTLEGMGATGDGVSSAALLGRPPEALDALRGAMAGLGLGWPKDAGQLGRALRRVVLAGFDVHGRRLRGRAAARGRRWWVQRRPVEEAG
jgi:hypothetical protein